MTHKKAVSHVVIRFLWLSQEPEAKEKKSVRRLKPEDSARKLLILCVCVGSQRILK